MSEKIEPGDKLISKVDIINIAGGVIISKGQEVTIRQVLTTPAHWSKICPDIWVPEKIDAIRLKGIYGDWQLGVFDPLTPSTNE